jgi:hypothetical protein
MIIAIIKNKLSFEMPFSFFIVLALRQNKYIPLHYLGVKFAFVNMKHRKKNIVCQRNSVSHPLFYIQDFLDIRCRFSYSLTIKI